MHQNLLGKVYCFRSLTKGELGALEKIATVAEWRQGSNVFSQGDEAAALYVIKEGSVQITHKTERGEKVKISTQGMGSHFGEMAFLVGERRSASAEVMEDSSIIAISYEDLRALIKSNDSIGCHIYEALAVFLAHRLRDTSHSLGSAQEKLRLLG